MNRTRPLYILDVFAEKKYTGNQLAVVRNAAELSDVDMQNIAREMHFSETTFLPFDESRNNGYNVRIFTPESELPFAGHPTLGTAFLIQQEIIRKPVKSIVLNEKLGPIPVTFEYDNHGNVPSKCWMKQNQPEFGETYDLNTISRMLNIDVKDIDSRFPLQSVSTGVPAIIVPLKNLKAVKKCRPNGEYYFEMLEKFKLSLMLVFAPETYSPSNQLNVRVFTDFTGIPEDPATGSGNGCLTAYLTRHRYFGGAIVDIKVEQGYEVKRPSLLYLRGNEKDGKIDVMVGGSVILSAIGQLV